MFVQLLEGLSAGEAECVVLAKDNSLSKKFKGLTGKCVQDAFGWDENFVDRAIASRNRPVDLGRTRQDFDNSQHFG